MTFNIALWVGLFGMCFLAPTAAAATDPVYVVMGPDGKPSLSNDNDHAGAQLVLAGHSLEVQAFRSRYRATFNVDLNVPNLSNVPRAPGKSRTVAPEMTLLVESAAARAGLNADLVKAVVMVESGFRPLAKSSAGAIGLMQVIPATGKRFGVVDLHDPVLNLYAGTSYLAYLLRYFKGDVRLALAGYNAGEGAVTKYGYRIPPYPETQAYVPAVLAAWRSFSERSESTKNAASLPAAP